MVDLNQNKKRCTANSMYIQNRSIRGVQGGGVVKYNILSSFVFICKQEDTTCTLQTEKQFSKILLIDI